MGDERERLQPPSSPAPARRPDPAPTAAPGKDDARREGGPGHDISAVRIHPADPGAWTKTLDRFALDSAALTGDHRKALDALAAETAARLALAPGAKAEISIAGHTDTSGDDTRNDKLGLERAGAAKAGLEGALARKKVAATSVGAIGTESFGETRLAVGTADGVKEPANRRVEITVRIEAAAPRPTAAPARTPSPDAEPERKPVDLGLPKDYRLPEEDWWTRAERDRKRIEEYDRKHPRRTRSLTDVLADGVTEALEPLIRKLPKGLRDKARDAIRKGLEAGTEKACEAAIDASGVTGEEADAMKAACKAALKTRPGGER